MYYQSIENMVIKENICINYYSYGCSLGLPYSRNDSFTWNNVFSVYLEHWVLRKSQIKEDEKTIRNIIRFIKDDLEQRQVLLKNHSNKDYKPFCTDM